MKSIQYLLIITLLSACTWSEPDGPGSNIDYFPSAYILGFCPIEIQRCDFQYRTFDFGGSSSKKWCIYVRSVDSQWKNFDIPQFLPGGKHVKQPEVYWNKLREIGDTAYNEKRRIFDRQYGILAGDYEGYVIDGEIECIDVYCNYHVDSQHPAGTSLADMVKIIWSDPYWIVKNGYKSYSGEDAYYGYKGFPHANRVQRLEEFNKSTHLYMGHLFYIVPEEFQFDEGKQYTVILRLSDGKQVEIKPNVFHKPNE